MKKIFVYSHEISPDLIVPDDALVMAYEEQDGAVQVTMHFKKKAPHIILYGMEPYAWENFIRKLNRYPDYYRSFAEKISERLSEMNYTDPNENWIEELKTRENSIAEKEAVLHMVNQFNLLDLSELIEDRTHFEEALALLNNIGKRYRLVIYINGDNWWVTIGNNDSPYPSFSIALHVFLTKMEYYMTRNTRDVEYR